MLGDMETMLSKFRDSIKADQKALLLKTQEEEMWGYIPIDDEGGGVYRLSYSTSSVFSARIMKLVKKMESLPRMVANYGPGGLSLPPLSKKDGRYVHNFIDYTGDPTEMFQDKVSYLVSFDRPYDGERGFYNFDIEYRFPNSVCDTCNVRRITAQIDVDAEGNGISGRMFGGHDDRCNGGGSNAWKSECNETMFDAFMYRLGDIEELVDSLAHTTKKNMES